MIWWSHRDHEFLPINNVIVGPRGWSDSRQSSKDISIFTGGVFRCRIFSFFGGPSLRRWRKSSSPLGASVCYLFPLSLFIWWIYVLASINWLSGLQARNAIAMHTVPLYEWSFESFNCTSLAAAQKTRLLSNHPTVLSLRHSLIYAGLAAREAQLVQDSMISPKFFWFSANTLAWYAGMSGCIRCEHLG